MSGTATDKLRNVVLLSHSGAGKTATGEAMLFTAKVISRLGSVEEGNTVSDYEPEEAKRQTSIQLSILPCQWGGCKLNILDTPGYADFVGEVVSSLRAADAAVLVVAAPSGVEVGTEQMWRYVQSNDMPWGIFVNKMDRENADFMESLKQIQQAFGTHCVALNIPIGAEQAYQGIIDLLNPGDVPEGMRDAVQDARERLVEAIAETDDELATKYLEGSDLTTDDLVNGIKRGVMSRSLVPVLAGSATQKSGIAELMNALVHYMPAPVEAGEVTAAIPASNDGTVQLSCQVDGPLAAIVFKTTADPFVGKLSFFKVCSGIIRSNMEVWNATKSQAERIGQLFVPRGKSQEQVSELVAGEIGAVAKLASTVTGDTLCAKETPLVFEALQFPTPIYSVAVSPKSKADLDKMSATLARLAEEDPSLVVERAQDTGEIVISGIGETQIDVVAEKVKRKFGVDLLLSIPRVAYRETISMPAKVEYKHKKQSGGHGQYGHVFLSLEPQPRGQEFEFGSRVVGGSVPREYISSVEKGVTKALEEGMLVGFPLVDLKVTLYDGSYHPVDSSGMSFEIAGSHALRKGVQLAGPVLLEPIMKLSVTVPDAYTGEVIGDLNSKRAKILGMIPQDGTTVVESEVPQSEALRYATDLRSMTQGRGAFTVAFSHYEQVPAHIAQKIIDEESRNKESAKS